MWRIVAILVCLLQVCLSFGHGTGRHIWSTRGRAGSFPFQSTSVTTALYAKKKRSNGGHRRDVEEEEAEVQETKFIVSEETLDDEEGDEEELEAVGDDDNDDDDGVVSSIDDIIEDESESDDDAPGSASGVAAAKREQWQKDVSEIILQSIDAQGLNLNKLTFLPARIEIIAVGRPPQASSNGDVEEEGEGGEGDDEEDYIIPSVEALSSAHRDLYARFELREADLDVVARYEIVVASPGIGQFLRTRRDFESFRGFPVVVNVKEEYKKKKTFEGTLVERDKEDVSISLKGRIVKIPRVLIDTVSLPKAKFEVTDTEMRKLR